MNTKTRYLIALCILSLSTNSCKNRSFNSELNTKKTEAAETSSDQLFYHQVAFPSDFTWYLEPEPFLTKYLKEKNLVQGCVAIDSDKKYFASVTILSNIPTPEKFADDFLAEYCKEGVRVKDKLSKLLNECLSFGSKSVRRQFNKSKLMLSVEDKKEGDLILYSKLNPKVDLPSVDSSCKGFDSENPLPFSSTALWKYLKDQGVDLNKVKGGITHSANLFEASEAELKNIYGAEDLRSKTKRKVPNETDNFVFGFGMFTPRNAPDVSNEKAQSAIVAAKTMNCYAAERGSPIKGGTIYVKGPHKEIVEYLADHFCKSFNCEKSRSLETESYWYRKPPIDSCLRKFSVFTKSQIINYDPNTGTFPSETSFIKEEEISKKVREFLKK